MIYIYDMQQGGCYLDVYTSRDCCSPGHLGEVEGMSVGWEGAGSVSVFHYDSWMKQ